MLCDVNPWCDNNHTDRFRSLVDLCILQLRKKWDKSIYDINNVISFRRTHGWPITETGFDAHCNRCLLHIPNPNDLHCMQVKQLYKNKQFTSFVNKHRWLYKECTKYTCDRCKFDLFQKNK